MDTAAAFSALGEPTRLALVEELAGGERAVGSLVERVGVSQPAVSQHLKLLREVGLVTVRAQGQRRLYRLHADGFRVIELWLERHRRSWANRLDTLERHMDDHPEEET